MIDIEEKLVAAALHPEDRELTGMFIEALLGSYVLVLGYPANEEGQIPPLILTSERGQVLPFFTSQERVDVAVAQLHGLADGELEVSATGYQCREIFAAAIRNQTPMALNLFSEYGKEFNVAEMSDLLRGVEPGSQQRVSQGESIKIGRPAHVSDELRQGLYRWIEFKPGIKGARLCWIEYSDGLQGYLVVVVTDTDRDTVLDGVDDLAKLAEGKTLDVMINSVEEGPGVAETVEPFYVGLDA